jgi:hypothetical protein
MSFKDQIAADMSTVFLNTNEFADMHDVHGQQISCVIDDDISKKRGTRQSENFDGIYARQITIFVSEADIGYRPERDQKITFDGEWYIVIDCLDSEGILEIELGANRP